MIWDVIPDPESGFSIPDRIPDPGVKKTTDPGSGFATLSTTPAFSSGLKIYINIMDLYASAGKTLGACT
jgi:hypothetical protein